ncbi:aldolase catalytic domain-containing protein [Ruminococcus sp.]|jgi:4-hydroxy 2-oxovalerate aldolase|uniref:aldolase catalytic domain-containing protein n=1 Tax=Ruminococcus sp. TaxID=41978 RepID=UPI0015B0151D|nr:aldolase catalytic domain-containing protein [Ruminococcus sp.]MEE0022564.1 aldolase catalytic domain-containing protein [Ruminococcus sp.]
MQDAIKGTMISYRPDIKVLDATIRDGGLVNNFEFTDQFVRDLYQANVRAGVDVMEIGYLADPELFDESKFGKWKFCHEEAIREVLEDLLDPSLKLAVMADVGRANVVRDLPDKQDSILDMVRIATYINTIPAAIEMIETCAKKGYQTTVNIMAVSKAQESELAEALDMLGKSSVNVIYLVDSYGSLYPLQMRQLAQRYLEAAETYGKQIGIHAHNNQQLAFANTTECAMMGVSYLDATMGGMGRGAGNCAMELLLGFLKNPKYDIKPVLRFLEKHIQKLKHDGVVWGYDIQYLLTGYLNQHPRTAIAFTKEEREDYFAFFQELQENEG